MMPAEAAAKLGLPRAAENEDAFADLLFAEAAVARGRLRFSLTPPDIARVDNALYPRFRFACRFDRFDRRAGSLRLAGFRRFKIGFRQSRIRRAAGRFAAATGRCAESRGSHGAFGPLARRARAPAFVRRTFSAAPAGA